MKNTRKLLVGVMAAAGFAAATVIVYAAPPAGFGPGGGGAMGSGMMGHGPGGGGAMGPGMMGHGPGGGGAMGPGMMGYEGPRGGYGPGMMGGSGPRGGSGPGAATGGPVAHHEARLAFLKSELKITADQESAWEAYARQAKAQAETMESFHTQPPVTAQTTPERLEQRVEFAKQRAEQLKATSAALKNLYAVLTPEQKAIADRYFGGMHASPRASYGRGR